jgi:hypothetical protein
MRASNSTKFNLYRPPSGKKPLVMASLQKKEEPKIDETLF